MTSISHQTILDFKSALRGPLLQPGDGPYEEARHIWNAMVDRHPALIVQCAGVADVMRSVAFARANGLALALRGGGHNIAGNAMCDDGLVLDMSRMKSVRVDAGQRRAYVEGGATLGDFDHETQAFGLATPMGINSTTGVAGLTLGGGFGWLSRKYGMTVDNLRSADIVTAQGQLLRASDTENPDLFWALRGGGGNFGAVTMFEYQLHALGPQVLCGLVVFPFDQARAVLTRYRDFVNTMPDELSVWVVMRQAPPLPFLPPEVHGKDVVVLALCYAGDVDDGQRAIAAVRGFGQPCGEHVGAQPYEAWQKAFDPLLAPGARNYWKSHNFAALSNDAIGSLIDCADALASPQCEIFLGLVGGQASRPGAGATAYAHRDALYVMNVHARWTEAREDDKCVAWARKCFDAMKPYATGGVYVNFLTADESARIGAAYGQNYGRLAQVKQKYDPTNLFRQNQNIKPAP